MLEKNKNCIEFSMHSMMLTHMPYQEDTEITITGMIPGRETLTEPNPFDIPCDVVMVPKKDFEKLQKEIEHYKRDVTRLQARADHESELARQRGINYDSLLKMTGFDTVADLVDYLDDAECDTLQEAISKLHDEVKYTCDELEEMKKDLKECEKDYISKRDKAKALEKEIGIYSRALNEWKEITGCPSPLAVKTMIESQASWCHAYHEAKKANEKLGDNVKSWQNVTGYSTPEDYMRARLNITTPFDYTAACQIATEQLCCGRDLRHNLQVDLEYYRALSSAQANSIYRWKEATKCNTPDDAKKRIDALNERIDESEADYNHLLCTTGFESEGEIEDALDQCDHSTLRKALVDYEFDYEALLKLTGYKSEQDIRVTLNHSEQFVYETLRELINSLNRKAKFIESNWQKATGCDTPGVAEERIKYYKSRLGNAVQAASCAAKHLDNITF